MKTTTEQPSGKWNLPRLFTLICTILISTLSFSQAGNAPMQSLPQFPGPFAIDGFLQRQGANGDWLAAAGGSANNYVFTNAGVPLVPLAYHLIDLFNDQTLDDIFDGGNKLFQNPNDWGWRSQKPPAKDDINNALVFIALNPIDNHIWVAIAGDRLSTNGTSYLDFEFYQKPITKTGGPIPGGTGGFSSLGTEGGRTVGDLSITLEYTQGGSFAAVKYLQWQPGSEAGSFDYFPLNPPAGTAFAAANGGATPINVPFGAFGSTQYQQLQFVEGAIDITALIGGTGDFSECASLPFKTLFIKSKSSAERTADLKDFISPLQINPCFDRTPPVLNCPPQLNLGCNPTIPGPSGATASDNCNGVITPVAADGPVSSNGCSRSMTRIWRATDACGNASTCGQLITWTEDHTGPVFTGSYINVDLGCNPANPTASLGTASATDACGPVTNIASADGSISTNGCSRSQTRTFTAVDGCNNSSTTSRTVTWVVDVTPPAFTGSYADVNLGCNPANPDGSLGSATATDVCGAVTITSSDGAVVSNGCNRSKTRTFTATDGCLNAATTSRTVRWIADRTPPVFTSTPASVDLDCLASIPGVVDATASDACGTTTVTMTGSTDNPANCTTGFKRIVTRTWTAVDGCGNTATYTQTIRVKCCATVCTLTQGAYGNAGGNICLPNGTTVNQTQIMINALTAAPGNMKVFGRQDLNRYWVIRLSDITSGNIFKMLPGGGPSKVFEVDNVAGVPEYSNNPSWPVVPLQPNGPQAGKIRNQLFSQTLTLYFNTTIIGVFGNTLADVKLDGSLVVIAPRNCGSSDPAGPGTPTQLVSPAISSYLASHGYAATVGGLLQLANDALGGVNVSPLTLSQIQEAIDNINNAFDGCKIVTGYVPAAAGGRVVTSNSTSSQPSLIVTAYPNPYQENFSLQINSPVTGQAMISFYTIDGVKIGEMKRDVVAKRDISVPFNVPAVYKTKIVYAVSISGYNAKGIVLSPN